MISTTTITRAARVVLQGYLTAAFFKVIVIDRTVLVVSRSDKVSIRLVTSTVCSSTAVLLLATTKAAQQFLSDDVNRVPVPKDVDDTAEPKAWFAGGKVADTISTTKALGAPAQPSSSPAVIESTEPAFDGPTECISTVDSDMTLIGRDEDLAKDVFSGDRDSDLDSGWLADESTFYQHDCQATTQCLTHDELKHALHDEYDSHTINNLIRRMSTLSLDNVPSHISIISLDDVISPISFADVPSHLSLDDVSSHFDLSLSFDNVSFDDVFDESTFYEHGCQATAQCLDDEPEHILPAEYDSHVIDNLVRGMSTLSLDNVPSHFSIPPPDNVLSPIQHTFSMMCLQVPFHPFISTMYRLTFQNSLSTMHCLPFQLLDNVASPTLTISLDSVPSPFPTHSLNDVPSHLSPSLDNVPSHLSALALMPHLDNCSIQSSKFQPQRPAVPDHAIDDLIRQMVALSLDHVSAQLSKLQPHLHDHVIDTPLCIPDALPLDDNHAIDTLLCKPDALLLPLDDNHAIDAPLQKSQALAFDDNYAINTQLCRSDALPLDDNHAIYTIDAVLQKSQALALDDNHAIDALLQKSEAPTFDNNHGFDALLYNSGTHTLGDDASQSPKYIQQDSINDSLRHRHLRHNTPLRNSRSCRSSEFQLRLTLHHDAIDTILRDLEPPILDDTKRQPQHILLARP
ncbi:hypothetical protein EDD22DRAFT_130518 [Suillus occidentalis]|nr:hypothetical protein EDD22DRAFT_130518 [Suillus occidentalis]